MGALWGLFSLPPRKPLVSAHRTCCCPGAGREAGPRHTAQSSAHYRWLLVGHVMGSITVRAPRAFSSPYFLSRGTKSSREEHEMGVLPCMPGSRFDFGVPLQVLGSATANPWLYGTHKPKSSLFFLIQWKENLSQGLFRIALPHINPSGTKGPLEHHLPFTHRPMVDTCCRHGVGDAPHW